MQKGTFDCQTRKWAIEDLTSEEQQAKLAETKAALEREQAQIKHQLAILLAELREMRESDIFDDGDVADKQSEINEVVARLNGVKGK